MRTDGSRAAGGTANAAQHTLWCIGRVEIMMRAWIGMRFKPPATTRRKGDAGWRGCPIISLTHQQKHWRNRLPGITPF